MAFVIQSMNGIDLSHSHDTHAPLDTLPTYFILDVDVLSRSAQCLNLSSFHSVAVSLPLTECAADGKQIQSAAAISRAAFVSTANERIDPPP